MTKLRKPSRRATIALIAAVVEMLAEVLVDYEGPIKAIWRALLSATGATALIVMVGCGYEPTEWDFEPVRDPRILESANAVMGAWEAELKYELSPAVVTEMFGTPVGFSDDICHACGADTGCDVRGCFSPYRGSILIDVNQDGYLVFTWILPVEQLHALEWYEQGKVDYDHSGPVWKTVLPRAVNELRDK